MTRRELAELRKALRAHSDEVLDACLEKPSKSEVASIGGEARARALTPERRKEIARKAAQTRWKRSRG